MFQQEKFILIIFKYIEKPSKSSAYTVYICFFCLAKYTDRPKRKIKRCGENVKTTYRTGFDVYHLRISVLVDSVGGSSWPSSKVQRPRSLGLESYWGMAKTCSTKSPSKHPASNLALFSFFHFIRRFWNQILICRSVRQSA